MRRSYFYPKIEKIFKNYKNILFFLFPFFSFMEKNKKMERYLQTITVYKGNK